MPKYVAFLRAINVGGHMVKMDRLKSLFTALGFANVETFIASGNVIFDSGIKNTATLERKIEKHLRAELGYEVATFIREIADLAGIIRFEPFDRTDLETEGHTLYVGFLAAAPGAPIIEKVRACSTAVDALNIAGREVYWLCRTTFSESQFTGARLEKTLGTPTTIRNVNTVKRIAAKY